MLAVAAVVVVIEKRPARADDLKIPVAELRSQAFELTLLDVQLARGLSPSFGAAHVGQLARSISLSREELGSLKTIPALAPSQAEALRLSGPLARDAARVAAERPTLGTEAKTQRAGVAASLKALEKTLER